MLHRALPSLRSRAASVLLVLVLVLAGPGAAAAGPPVVVSYVPPVPGSVLRGYEEPAHRYAAGHRGVDLAVAVGEPIAAAAPGRVTFAGQVGGEVWVTVAHPDGVRTSYGELTELRVGVGDAVAAGDVLGRATGRHRSRSPVPHQGLHWSARQGETYLDPRGLLDRPPPRASLVGPGGWWGSHPVVVPYQAYEPGRWFAGDSPPAQRPGFALPPNHHHVVLVPGFATAGPHDLLTPGYLGYGDDDASRFSYAGCEPSPDGCEPRPFGGSDTHVDVLAAAETLREHLRGRQRAQPWRPVDLLGHSMGGDVVTAYLEHLHDPTDPTLPPIGSAVTYGTPFGGSAVAGVGRALSDSLVGTAVGEGALAAARALGVAGSDRIGLDVAPVRRYGSRRPPERDLARLAELGVDLHPFAGSWDLVVAPHRAAPSGTTATVLPGSHAGMLDSEAALLATHAVLGGGEAAGADGPLVAVGPRLVDRELRGVATTIDGAELLLRGRVVRRGIDGAMRFLTGEKRFDPDAVEPAERPAGDGDGRAPDPAVEPR